MIPNGIGNGKPKLTPTQRRMLGLLSDGLPHPRRELVDLLWDQASHPSTIQMHISNLRKKIAHKRQDIACVLWNRKICYRLVGIIRPRTLGRAPESAPV